MDLQSHLDLGPLPSPPPLTEDLQRPYEQYTVYTWEVGWMSQTSCHTWTWDTPPSKVSEMHYSISSDAETRDNGVDFAPQLPQHCF